MGEALAAGSADVPPSAGFEAAESGAPEEPPAAVGDPASAASPPPGWHPVTSNVAADTATMAIPALRMLFPYFMTPPD